MWEGNFKHKTPKIGKYFQIWPHVEKACSGWAFYSLGIRKYFPSKRLVLPYCTQIKFKNNSGSIFNGWIVRKFVFSKPPSRNLKNPDHPQSDLGLIRKLITTDINSYFLITGNLMVVVHCFRYLSDICNIFGILYFMMYHIWLSIVHCFSVAARTLNGPLPLCVALFFRCSLFQVQVLSFSGARSDIYKPKLQLIAINLTYV